jgi:epoxyqueuosine reductase
VPGNSSHDLVRQWLAAEGFHLSAVAAAVPLPAARDSALAALQDGHLDGMDWITATWLARSAEPDRFLPGARNVVLVALPCHSPEPAESVPRVSRGRIARYARGRDYHRVFEKGLRRVAARIRDELGADARPTVDYGPLLERSFASQAGLGWRGKSTMLLVPGFGPWVLLGAIATTLELPAATPIRKTCGSCTRCVVACPTGALGAEGNLLDSRLCISYHTIENRGPIPRDLRASFGDWIFGCDLCLDSCPVGADRWQSHPDFIPPSVEEALPALAPLLQLDEQGFRERFRGRPILRAKRDGFLRNVCIALGNTGTAEDLPALFAALDDSSPLVRGHAAWGVAALALRIGATGTAAQALSRRLAAEQDAYVRDEIEAALRDIPTVVPLP